EEARAARQRMIELVAEVDEEVLALFVEGVEVSESSLRAGLGRATIAGRAVPVLYGAAFRNKGVQPLLDAVVDYLPSPEDMPAVTGKDPQGLEVPRQPTDAERFAALAFKIMNDPFVGSLTYFRVYSGKVQAGQTVYN